ncbi:DMT family transporter [Sphingomicrobium lutaoense]|uniref:S-adenosylmethionine uptake transporter n=1 Tax=Sphingomicrobium lutaoense TaxID=515949 RepID=A0A839Z5E2_9SPHN|nr:DMT family transporter [Sphingomicrobium lutaoense]MBB3764885.1 S-adenosylmethionine uptake transporter [Sphingomicrobium lutaoense]
MAMQRISPLLAYLVAILAVGFLSGMDAAMKKVGLEHGALAALSWRALIAAPLVGMIYFWLRKGPPGRTALRYHWMRGVLMVPMSIAFFWGLNRVPMAQAIALAFIAPLLALVLAGPILGERVGPRIVAGSLLAFAGVLTIFAGQAQADLGRDAMLGSLSILGSACLYALNILLMRRQSQSAGPWEIAFFYFAVAGLGFWIVNLFTGLPPFPQESAGTLVIATLLSIAGMLGLAWAYAHGEAAYLSSSEYSGFIWAAFIGFLVFGEIPSPWTMAGAVAIVTGCWIAARTRRVDHAMEAA